MKGAQGETKGATQGEMKGAPLRQARLCHPQRERWGKHDVVIKLTWLTYTASRGGGSYSLVEDSVMSR
eukprot:7455629-Pyramimonas_sp.AAC.1